MDDKSNIEEKQNRFGTFVDLMKQTFTAWQDDGASHLAAALAFYTTFSLAPILLIALAVAGAIVGNEAARGELTREMTLYIGANGTRFVLALLDQARGRIAGQTATIIGLLTSLFGATVVFVELQSALNRVWNVRLKKEFNIWRTESHIRHPKLIRTQTLWQALICDSM